MKLLRKMLPIITPVVAGLAAMMTPATAQAAWTQVSDYTPSGGPISAPAAGGQLGASGWYDAFGGKWSVDGSNNLQQVVLATAANTGLLARANTENSVNGRVVTTFTTGTTLTTSTFALLRQSTASSNSSGYAGGCGGGNVQAYVFINGTATQLASTAYSFAANTKYVCDVSVVQTSPTTTTVTATLFASDGVTQLAQATKADTTASQQNKSGAVTVYQYSPSVQMPINRLTTYAQTATTYTLSGPTAGASGAASGPFTATLNGILGSAATITPSDGGNGGSFSPTSVSVPAGQSIGTFTYTPTSTGAKTLSTTNNQSLTDPASQTFQSLVLIPTSSTAFHFSPANWQCYGQRACATGVVNPRTIQVGAYYCVAWNASASPNAVLSLGTNSNAMKVSYFLNGTLVDNVTATNSLTLSPTASATNQLMVVTRSIANPGTNIWGQTGTTFYGLEVGGLLVDSASSAGVAPAPCQPSGRTDIAYKGWGLIHGTSINVGLATDAGVDNYLHGNIWLAWQAMFAQGYDFGTMATSGSGIVYAGGSYNNFVPGLYVVTSGGYQASASRWYLTDAGVSMLDGNNHLSAYGATGTEPLLVSAFEGTNDANNNVTPSYMQQAVPGLMAALRAAAPAAKITLVPDGPLYAGTVTNGSAILAAMQAGAAAYSNDPAFTFIDQGMPFASMIYNTSNGLRQDAFHPNANGNALIGPYFGSIMQKALNPGAVPTFRSNFR